MKKFLLLHFWFGRKNRTYGLTYSCFEYFFFSRKKLGKSKGRRKTRPTEMLVSAYTFFFIFIWHMFSMDCCVKGLSLERSTERMRGS